MSTETSSESTQVDLDLMPSEQMAADFVSKIGIERAQRILDAICRRFDRRYQKACDKNPLVPINPEWVRNTPLELDLTHRIKMGLTILDDYNTPYAAHQRILTRIAKRNADRAARKAKKEVCA